MWSKERPLCWRDGSRREVGLPTLVHLLRGGGPLRGGSSLRDGLLVLVLLTPPKVLVLLTPSWRYLIGRRGRSGAPRSRSRRSTQTEAEGRFLLLSLCLSHSPS